MKFGEENKKREKKRKKTGRRKGGKCDERKGNALINIRWLIELICKSQNYQMTPRRGLNWAKEICPLSKSTAKLVESRKNKWQMHVKRNWKLKIKTLLVK